MSESSKIKIEPRKESKCYGLSEVLFQTDRYCG